MKLRDVIPNKVYRTKSGQLVRMMFCGRFEMLDPKAEMEGNVGEWEEIPDKELVEKLTKAG